jgi:hypothetical protein
MQRSGARYCLPRALKQTEHPDSLDRFLDVAVHSGFQTPLAVSPNRERPKPIAHAD